MNTLLALLYALVRLVRPHAGTHRRTRSRRVRPFVAETAPVVPAPRKPSDDRPRSAMAAVAPVGAPEVQPQAALVRPYLVAHERAQEQRRTDATRLGVAVLADIARSASRTEVVA